MAKAAQCTSPGVDSMPVLAEDTELTPTQPSFWTLCLPKTPLSALLTTNSLAATRLNIYQSSMSILVLVSVIHSYFPPTTNTFLGEASLLPCGTTIAARHLLFAGTPTPPLHPPSIRATSVETDYVTPSLQTVQWFLHCPQDEGQAHGLQGPLDLVCSSAPSSGYTLDP